MSHVREQIRDEIATLITGLTTTGARVYMTRVMPMDDSALPGLTISTGPEEISTEAGQRISRVQERMLDVIISGFDKLSAGVDDQLDDIAAEVETAIFGATLTKCSYIDLANIETSVEAGAELPVGRITMTFRAHYLTADGAPSTLI
jgi:hypothetical protein